MGTTRRTGPIREAHIKRSQVVVDGLKRRAVVPKLVFWYIACTRGTCRGYEPSVGRTSVESHAKIDIPDFDDGIVRPKRNDKENEHTAHRAENEQHALAIRRQRHWDDGRVERRRGVPPVDNTGFDALNSRTASM